LGGLHVQGGRSMENVLEEEESDSKREKE